MQVFTSTVKLLNDDQLKELGIDAIGDRARLKKMCAGLTRSDLQYLS